MNEHLKFRGRLSIKEEEAREKRMLICGIVKSLRDLLDPTEKVEDLKGELIAGQALDLANRQIEYIALLSEIREIKKLLGRE